MMKQDRNAGLKGGLFEQKHRERMGSAIWLFGWLVMRQTKQEEGVGLVLHGRPLRYSFMAKETGYNLRALKDDIARLKKGGYIRLERVMQGGYCVGSRVFILNAKKWNVRQFGLFAGAGHDPAPCDAGHGTEIRPSHETEIRPIERTENRHIHGTENRPIKESSTKLNTKEKQQQRRSAAAPPLPDWVPQEAWKAFREMRQRIRAPMTNYGEERLLRRLERLKSSGQDPGAVIEQSVMLGYRGLFVVKDERSGNGANGRRGGAGGAVHRENPDYARRGSDLTIEV